MHNGEYGAFIPHLTIGQASLNGGVIEKLVEKAEKLEDIEWEIKTLVVLKRDHSGEMRVFEELAIGDPMDVDGWADDMLHLHIDTQWRTCHSFTKEYGWDRSFQYTKGISSTSAIMTSTELTVTSWNIMAEDFAPPFATRLPLIIDAISSATSTSTSSVKVLCLQEVNFESLPLLLSDPFIQETYPYATHHPGSLLPSHRNLLTLASAPFTHSTLQFAEMHKSALVVTFNDLGVEIANVHLTSALTDQAVISKRNQMLALTDFLKRDRLLKKDILVVGDFNLTTSTSTIETAVSKRLITFKTARSVRGVIDNIIWADAFEECKNFETEQATDEDYEGEEGATFDRLTNPLAAMAEVKIDRRPQRYDRIIFKKGGHVHVKDFKRLGFPLADGQCASDHYGVSATLVVGEGGIGDAELDSAPAGPEIHNIQLEDIDIVEDSTDVEPFIEPYLPSNSDRIQREDAIQLLRDSLSDDERLTGLILAPLGSYAMDTYLADSDVDVLAIGSVTPRVFFEAAVARLKTLNAAERDEVEGFKAVHFVNSLVPIVEAVLNGIKFDIQYCQASGLVKRFHTTMPAPTLVDLVFDKELISTLPPYSLRPLNTYRDTAYLIHTIPSLPIYRTAHRFLSLYLKRRGLYSAKFGYLGGVHLSLMLSRVMKLLSASPNQSNSTQANPISPASLIRTFFTHYASFNFSQSIIRDPQIAASHKAYDPTSRSTREPVLIQSIHKPTARVNIAASCTHLSALTLSTEFSLASSKLQQGDWNWCLQSQKASAEEFVEGFGAFVRVAIEVWEVWEMGNEQIREILGVVESRMRGLLVALGRVEGVEGRVWPGRFYTPDPEKENGKGKGKQEQDKMDMELDYIDVGENEDDDAHFKGYYLIGIAVPSSNSLDPDRKRFLENKIVDAARVFERNLRALREIEKGNVWVEVDVVPKKTVSAMALVLDTRLWATSQSPLSTTAIFTPPSSTTASTPALRSTASKPKPKTNKPTTKLRPVQDIISRIRWDPSLSVSDFVVGYEDRFVGIKEIELSAWKMEQTDLEFIPLHRIMWVRRKEEGREGAGAGVKVWDRRERVNLLHGN